MIYALGNYCEWLQGQNPDEVAYCVYPPPDCTAGPGPWLGTTGMVELNGYWMDWQTPANQTNAQWKFGVQYGFGIIAMCTVNLSGKEDCQPTNDYAVD